MDISDPPPIQWLVGRLRASKGLLWNLGQGRRIPWNSWFRGDTGLWKQNSSFSSLLLPLCSFEWTCTWDQELRVHQRFTWSLSSGASHPKRGHSRKKKKGACPAEKGWRSWLAKGIRSQLSDKISQAERFIRCQGTEVHYKWNQEPIWEIFEQPQKKWVTGWEIEDGDIILHFQRGQENEFWKWQAEDVESVLEETIFLLLKVFCLITRWNSNHWDPLGSPRKTLHWTGLMFSLAILLGWLATKMQKIHVGTSAKHLISTFGQDREWWLH